MGKNTRPSARFCAGTGERAALASALAHVGARHYMWQTTDAAAATFLPTGRLVVMRSAAGTGEPVLAWKFNVYAAPPISRAFIYVDARSSKVVFTDAIIKHAAATGTFATAYSGVRTSNDGTMTGGFFLRDGTARGQGIETYNAKKGNSYSAAEYNNANFDNVAGDAHVGAQATYDYWKNEHGRNSYDNAGAKIKSYVHFDDVPGGPGFENACWNGSVMTYGDGASRFRPSRPSIGRGLHHQHHGRGHLGARRGRPQRPRYAAPSRLPAGAAGAISVRSPA